MKKPVFKYLILFFIAAVVCGVLYFYLDFGSAGSPGTVSEPILTTPATDAPPVSQVTPESSVFPVSNPLARVTKKPFGIKITPQSSPVSPERFSGYHTGADFETFDDEQNIEIAVNAICTGALLVKKYSSGYGGVAVQLCQLGGSEVTVIYGHLRLDSIEALVGDTLKTGKKIGVLGRGFSLETDGERKHLHLAIHKGKTVSLLGYVQNSSDLSQWIDPMTALK